MKRDSCLWPAALLACFVTFACTHLSHAATIAIASGQFDTGTISSGTSDAYTFTGNPGDNIVVRVGGTNFSPRIDFYVPGGAVVTNAIPPNGNYRDTVLYVQLTNSGTFTAVVSSGFAGGAGGYGIKFAQIPGSFVVPSGEAGGPMANGALNRGQMILGGFDLWSFSGNAGDNLQLRMGGTNFSPRIDVYGPNGVVLTNAIPANGNYRDALLTLNLTNSGRFTVVVSSYYLYGSGLVTIGGYTLNLAQVPESFVVSPGEQGGSLVNGTRNVGQMGLGDLQMWTFTGSVGDSIQLRMGGTNFSPQIDLYGLNGVLLTNAIPANGNYRDALLTLNLTNSGTFTVVVSSYYLYGSGLGTIGGYTLNLAQVPESFVVSPGEQGGPLTNGVRNVGQLGLGDLQMWTFTGNRGDSIQLRMGGTNFSPQIDLYGPNGVLLTNAIPANGNYRDAWLALDLTNSGTFTVVVSSFYLWGSGLGTIGGYTLNLAQIPGAFTVAPGDFGGVLTNGFLEAGTLGLGGLDMWSFSGNAGDNIELRMGTPTFSPRIDFYGPGGVLLTNSFPPNGNYHDGGFDLQLTNSGTFTAVVSSFYLWGSGLNSIGDYTLTLAREPGQVFVAPGDQGGVMVNGFTYQGTNSVGDLKVWSFYGTVGDSNLFRFGTVNFDPWLRLYGPNGSLVAQAFDLNGSVRTNFLTYIVTNAGNYTLVSSSYYLNGSGTYNLKQSRVPPDLVVPDTQTINDLGSSLMVQISAQDPDDATKALTFALVSGPPGMSLTTLGPTNASLSWTTTDADGPSTNLVVVTVTDLVLSKPFIRTNTFTIVVLEINKAPILPAIPPQTVNELATLNVTNTATEPDLHSTTIGYGLINPPQGAQINGSGVFSWTPAQTQSPSTNTITVVVTNNNPYDLINPQLTATNTFTVVVREVNMAPVLPLIGPQTVNELATLFVTNAATEPNIHSTTIGYGLLSPPSGAVIDATGVFKWTPAQTQSPSTNTFVVVVTNANPYDLINPHLTATNSFTVVVKEVNAAPTLPAIGPQSVNEQTLLTVTNAATEFNIHSTTTGYTLVNPPNGMVIDANGVIKWTPAQTSSPSTNVITTVVTNSNPYDTVNPRLTATNSFTVVVKEVNVAPTLSAVGPQTVNELALLTVNNSATESNIHSTTAGYMLLNPPNGANIDASGVVKWTPAQDQSPSTNVITTVATNSNPYDTVNPNLAATNTFTVVVKEVNVAPALPNLPPVTINELATLMVTNTAMEQNIHATTLGYGLLSAPLGVKIDSSGIIAWTPTRAQSATTNTITTVVTNADLFDTINPHLNATNIITVVVLHTNAPPSLTPIGDTSVHYGVLLSVQAVAADPDIPADILTFSLAVAPTNMTINASNGLITWTPALAQLGSNTVTVKVTDNGQPPLSATTTFHVLVIGNQPQLSVQGLPGHLVQLNVIGDVGVAYDLQASTNLLNWSDLASVSNSIPYIDPFSSTIPRRFYRLKLTQ
jgi:hypothetical protein